MKIKFADLIKIWRVQSEDNGIELMEHDGLFVLNNNLKEFLKKYNYQIEKSEDGFILINGYFKYPLFIFETIGDNMLVDFDDVIIEM